MTTGSAGAGARKQRLPRKTHNPDEMTPSRRAGCGKSACPVRCGGGRRRSDGEPYTGTKLETADTAKGSLHATAPAPDPTVQDEASVIEHAQERVLLPDCVTEGRSQQPALVTNLVVLGLCPAEERRHVGNGGARRAGA
jgi:hypothetical protein